MREPGAHPEEPAFLRGEKPSFESRCADAQVPRQMARRQATLGEGEPAARSQDLGQDVEGRLLVGEVVNRRRRPDDVGVPDDRGQQRELGVEVGAQEPDVPVVDVCIDHLAPGTASRVSPSRSTPTTKAHRGRAELSAMVMCAAPQPMSAASRSVGRTRLRATWSYQARSSSTATTVSYVAMALTPPRRLERGSGAAAARSAAAPTGGGLAGAAAEPHGGQQ